MKASFTSFLLLILFSTSAFGWSAKIGSPEIGHRAAIDKAGEMKVKSVVAYMSNELKFIEGRFINEFSTQRFGGKSSKVSRFIDLLNEVGLWEVEILFRDFEEQESAFALNQKSPDSISVTVNSGRKDFLLKDFVRHFPSIVLSKPDVPKSERGRASQSAAASESEDE